MLVSALRCIVRVAFPALLLVVFAFPALLFVVFAFPALLLAVFAFRAFIGYLPLYLHLVVIGSCPSLLRFEGTLH